MNEGPLVSILMTVFNREKYLALAIESVLNSTYQNWELIIVDDQSSDNSVNIAKEYESKDNRIKVYINEKNLGDYPNRNKAAAYAKGKYLKYLDADDLIYPHGLKILVESMEKFPEAGYGLCSLDPDKEKPFPFMLGPKETYKRHYSGTYVFHKAPLSSIIRRDVFNKIGGFNNKLKKAGDFEMWNKLSQKYSTVLIQQGLVWYREHEEQSSKTQNLYEYEYFNNTMKYLKDKSCPLNQTNCKKFIIKNKISFSRKIIRLLIKLKTNEARKQMKKSTLSIIEVINYGLLK